MDMGYKQIKEMPVQNMDAVEFHEMLCVFKRGGDVVERNSDGGTKILTRKTPNKRRFDGNDETVITIAPRGSILSVTIHHNGKLRSRIVVR